jgi:hypothetical protein
MLPDRNKLLQYKHQHVLDRYKKNYPNNKLSAEEAFSEVLNYLWLHEKHSEEKQHSPNNEALNFECAVYSEMQEIDDMWNTFIVFTKDYAQFCQQYFGKFIHHNPTNEQDRISAEEFEEEFRRYLAYIYDNLGADALKRWFREYFGEEVKVEANKITETNVNPYVAEDYTKDKLTLESVVYHEDGLTAILNVDFVTENRLAAHVTSVQSYIWLQNLCAMYANWKHQTTKGHIYVLENSLRFNKFITKGKFSVELKVRQKKLKNLIYYYGIANFDEGKIIAEGKFLFSIKDLIK